MILQDITSQYAKKDKKTQLFLAEAPDVGRQGELMRRSDGVEAAQGVVEPEHLDLDAHTKGKSRDATTVGAAQLLAAHVVVAGTQVEAFGNQELRTKDGMPEKIVHHRKFCLDRVTAQIDLWRRILVIVNEVGGLQVGRGQREAQRHVLETLGNADLNLERQRCIHAIGRFPFRQVETHVPEDHSGSEKSAFADVGTAKVESHGKMRTVAAHIGVDQLEIRPDAEAIHLPCASDHQGKVRGRETACLVAIDIRLDHFPVAQELDATMEVSDVFKGMRITRVAVGNVAQVVGHRHGDRLVHRVIGKRRIHQRIVQVMVIGGDVHPAKGGNPSRGAQIEEIIDVPATNLGIDQNGQASEE